MIVYLKLIKKTGSVKVIVKPAAVISPGNNIPFQMYNIVMKKILRLLKLKPIGRNYFDPTKSINDLANQYKIKFWPGYFVAVGPSNQGTSLIVDVNHKAVRTDSVLDLINFLNKSSKQWKNAAEEQLRGQIVITNYSKHGARTYRVSDIEWNKTPKDYFEMKDGKKLTYVDYYRSTHGINIKDQDQPLLIIEVSSKSDDKKQIIYLIPELVNLTGIPEQTKKDFEATKSIATIIKVDPGKRRKEIDQFINTIKTNEKSKKELELWGTTIDSKPIETDGFILSSGFIKLGNGKTSTVDQKGLWNNAFTQETTLVQSKELKEWILVYSRNNERDVKEFLPILYKVSYQMGMKISPPIEVPLNSDTSQHYIDSIEKNFRQSIQLVFCILPNNHPGRYSDIKKACSINLKVPSQCLIVKNLRGKKTMSIATKVAIQINAKLGGIVWEMETPLSDTMIVGIDVGHHGRGSKKQSIAGFCATMNPKSFTNYFSKVSIQSQNQEIINNLRSNIKDALKSYFQKNKSLPKKIIIYRDGVGDGQLGALIDFEIPQFKAAFLEFPSYNPELLVVVVKKKINTRLFSGSSNPYPGTLVDTGCTQNNWYDFFLVSQHVNQGTASPTHYHVIYDTCNIKPYHFQLLTYRLCHLYYNWTGTVRVPSPCAYAHRLAFLTTQHLHQSPAKELDNLLHFL